MYGKKKLNSTFLLNPIWYALFYLKEAYNIWSIWKEAFQHHLIDGYYERNFC